MRPAASRLTAYYLSIAAGGALGGLFVTLVAPLIFNDHYELHLGILLAWLLALAALITDRESPFYDGGKGTAFAGLLGAVGLLLALMVAMFVEIRYQRRGVIAADRNFYGALQVAHRLRSHPDAYYEIVNGQISHGGQFADPINQDVAMWYYHAESGIGKVLIDLKPQPPRRVGLVGLGAGSLATYAQSGDSFHFYEINPQVIDFAEKYFTYLKNARDRGAQIEIHRGDARLVLERQEPQQFDVLVLDAFNGDSIPTHLLTTEAVDLYLRHLADDGILAVHVSNLYLALEAVAQALADHFDMEAARYLTAASITPGAGDTNWVLLHRRKGYFAERNFGEPLRRTPEAWPPVRWTDDYTNIIKIMTW
jgi:Spermine/spermidine synthase domain